MEGEAVEDEGLALAASSKQLLASAMVKIVNFYFI